MKVSAALQATLAKSLIRQLRQLRQDAALSRLSGQNLPICDWEEIEHDLASMLEDDAAAEGG